MHSFYSNDKQTLKHQFDMFTCTQEKHDNNESQALALIIPHAAYMHSGNVAYCGYKALHEALYNTSPNALTFIMLLHSSHSQTVIKANFVVQVLCKHCCTFCITYVIRVI